ncbi:MAG: very short patch repair endonuclease [Phycisphaerae bacterium]|nr:very short patch repair endonuclease [Phycisphaerae bacterium]
MTPEQRSRCMSRIRSKNTTPELLVRSLVHRMGFRFRLHRRDLPGTPDLVFVGAQKVIFVHGCFWHQHPGCRHATQPATRADFWEAKFERNRARDRRACEALAALGWTTLVLWECEVRDATQLSKRLRRFLKASRLR